MKSAVIVAAGSSTRFGADKLNSPLFGRSVLETTLLAFDIADEVIVVGSWQIEGVKCVKGGATRSQSVALGLAAVSPNCDLVAIHDGARPFVSRSLVSRLYAEAERFGSAVPYLPISETLWQSKPQLTMQDRGHFFTVQTPQVFDFAKISAAFANATTEYTDESTLYYSTYGDVHFVEGQYSNKKITVPDDLPQYRVGVGFDVHAFGQGSGVTLGGVVVPYDKKLVGHSDADVLAHAICDAVLSASGNRDIGIQFPDTDDRFLGADSLVLLAQCVSMANDYGYTVENVSAVIICQQPKLAQYIPQMARNLAQVLHVSDSCVNLTATTTERLGALGNGDGIAVQAEALLARKI